MQRFGIIDEYQHHSLQTGSTERTYQNTNQVLEPSIKIQTNCIEYQDTSKDTEPSMENQVVRIHTGSEYFSSHH